jgi:hypothetical protein
LTIWLVAAVAGNRKYFKLRFRLKVALALIVAGIAIVAAIRLKSFQGCFPSVSNDAWSYASLGQYLTDYGRGTDGRIPHIDRYSATVWGTRFGTPSLLGFLAVVFHISTARALIPALLIVLVNGLLGFYSLTRTLGGSKAVALASGIFFVLCGWTSDAIAIGSFDNLLFLSLGGAFLARALLIVRGCQSWSALGVLAINSAALFYSYPEGVAVIAVVLAPFALQVVFRAYKMDRQLPLRLIAVVSATLALIVPYLPTWIAFLSEELSALNSLSRPGEGIFPGLLGPALAPALLGSGQEFLRTFPSTAVGLQNVLLAGAATILCVVGILRLRSWRLAGASAVLIAVGLAILQRAHLRYDYGLYKILLLSSLIWLPTMFIGIHGIFRHLEPRKRLLASIASCLILQASFLFERLENQGGVPYLPIKMKFYEQIQGLDKIIREQTVALACNGPLECEWAVYYARRLHAQLLAYSGYLKAYKSRILQNHENDQIPAYVLSDDPQPQSVWSNGRFWLSRLALGLSIVSIDAQNGLERLEGQRFLWIGDQPTIFYIVSDKERSVTLKSGAVLMGPTIAHYRYRRLRVRLENAMQEVEVSDHFAVPLQLHPGMNEVDVWCEDKPEILEQPNGDRRILLLGLVNYEVEPNTPGPSSSDHARNDLSQPGGPHPRQR